MTVVYCRIEDCVHRSKRASRKYCHKDNTPCHRCLKDTIVIKEPFDLDGEIEAVAGKENMAVCNYYEPIEKDC